MNTEELKMVLEAISSLGAAGKEAFIWWLALKYGSSLVSMFLISAVAVVIAYMVLRLVKTCNRSDQAVRNLAARLGVTNFDTWYAEDRRRLEAAIDAILGKRP